MLAEVDRVRAAGPRDVPGQRDTRRAGRPSVAAAFELGSQVKQLSFAASYLLPGPLGSDAADTANGSHPGPEVVRALLRPAWGLQERVEFVELSAHAAAYLFAEFEHSFVGDRVAGVVAVLGAGDHAGGVEDPEVL